MSQLTVFYSNRVELLFQRLKEKLFASPIDPFAKRLIVVSSPPLKSWLMLQLAKDPETAIAAGLEISYPDVTLRKLTSSEVLFPTKLELALAVEGELRHILCQEPSELWAPLIRYLTGKEERITALSIKLAHLFMQYRHYGRRMIEEWRREEGWQQELWIRLKDLFPVSNPADAIPKNCQVHLFSISHLSPFELDRFTRVAESVPVNYYLLSPCQAFWSDIRSERESRRLQAFWQKKGADERQLEQLDQYLRDCNPLLANFGRLGREMVQQLEERNIASEEGYCLPTSVTMHPLFLELLQDSYPVDGEQKSLHLLEAVQADLLLMRNPLSTEKINIESDRSIQVHAAPTKMREVQVVYDVLQQLIDQQSICPEDILVMAPDIMEYAPFIRMTFPQTGGIDYTILEARSPMENPAIQGFWHLLSLSRWTAEEILELFSNAAFRKAQKLSEEDLHVLTQWIRKSGVRWGESSVHRDEILKGRHCRSGMVDKSCSGTWEMGLERLFINLVTQLDAEEAIEIESTQADLLGKLLVLLRSLREDLKPLQPGTLRSLSEWSSYLQCLFETYFGEGVELLLEHLEAFPHREDLFPFSTIRLHLEEGLKKARTSYRETHLHAVRFCPLLPMRTVPAKVIILMGMQDGAFPRRDAAFSLNLLKHNPKADYCPSQTDYDRYLFLEALLSARKNLVLTYQSFSAEDNKEQPASLLIQELLAYLDRGYRVGDEIPSTACFFKHPFHAYDKSYFEADARFPSFSSRNYRHAAAFYGCEQAPFHFITHFMPSEATKQGIVRIDMRDLVQFARNPLKTYFNKTLGLFIPERKREVEEKFTLSHLDLHQLRLGALKGMGQEALEILDNKQQLPLGLFKDLALRQAAETVEEIQQHLKEADLLSEEIFQVELTHLVASPTRTEESLKIPPLHISCGETTYVISGKLSHVSAKGLITLTKKEKKEIPKLSPEFLVFNTLIERGQIAVDQKLIFARSGDIKSAISDRPEQALQDYLEYYLRGLAAPSPLLPAWIPHLLHLDPKEFKEKIDESLTSSFAENYNEDLKWLTRGKLNSASIYAHWKETAEKLFAEMFARWT